MGARRILCRGSKHRGAEGLKTEDAEGSEVWEGGVPLHTGGGVWGVDCSPENFRICDIKMVFFVHSGWYYLPFKCLFYTQKIMLLVFRN